MRGVSLHLCLQDDSVILDKVLTGIHDVLGEREREGVGERIKEREREKREGERGRGREVGKRKLGGGGGGEKVCDIHVHVVNRL